MCRRRGWCCSRVGILASWSRSWFEISNYQHFEASVWQGVDHRAGLILPNVVFRRYVMRLLLTTRNETYADLASRLAENPGQKSSQFTFLLDCWNHMKAALSGYSRRITSYEIKRLLLSARHLSYHISPPVPVPSLSILLLQHPSQIDIFIPVTLCHHPSFVDPKKQQRFITTVRIPSLP